MTDASQLGRLVEFDEESRKYKAVDLIKPERAGKIIGHSWRITTTLDQGVKLDVPHWDSSACTGFSCGYDLISSPAPAKGIGNAECFAIYQLAKTLDEYPGTDYEGSSVLGAAKAAVRLGYVGEYHWAFGIDEALQALSSLGPIVVGTDWTNSMFTPKPNGLLEVDTDKSDVAGGHAYMFRSIITSVDTQHSLLGKGEPIRKATPLLRLHQSWGKDWGVHSGEAFVWADDLDRLLKGISQKGECRVTTTPFKK